MFSQNISIQIKNFILLGYFAPIRFYLHHLGVKKIASRFKAPYQELHSKFWLQHWFLTQSTTGNQEHQFLHWKFLSKIRVIDRAIQVLKLVTFCLNFHHFLKRNFQVTWRRSQFPVISLKLLLLIPSAMAQSTTGQVDSSHPTLPGRTSLPTQADPGLDANSLIKR